MHRDQLNRGRTREQLELDMAREHQKKMDELRAEERARVQETRDRVEANIKVLDEDYQRREAEAKEAAAKRERERHIDNLRAAYLAAGGTEDEFNKVADELVAEDLKRMALERVSRDRELMRREIMKRF